MELGEKLLQARQEAGLSQRQLCGDTITRNMLSQIEHGTARPSMDTLRYLAARLGKPVSYFLEEEDAALPNWAMIRRARQAFDMSDHGAVRAELEQYREPDEIFDPECRSLRFWAYTAAAEQALAEGKRPYAVQLLEKAGEPADEAARRRWILLCEKLGNRDVEELASQLPCIDEELILRARAALKMGEHNRAGNLLDAAEDRTTPQWALLRGKVWLAKGCWQQAAECFRRTETEYPEETAPMLERCYRELGDYKAAYEYACRQIGKR